MHSDIWTFCCMSTIPVLEEKHLSSQGGNSVQDHGRITGIRGGGGLRSRLNRILVRVWTWRLNKIRISLQQSGVTLIKDCAGVFSGILMKCYLCKKAWMIQPVRTNHRETGCHWHHPGAEQRCQGFCMCTQGTWEHQDHQSETSPGSGQTHGQPPWRGRSLQQKTQNYRSVTVLLDDEHISCKNIYWQSS